MDCSFTHLLYASFYFTPSGIQMIRILFLLCCSSISITSFLSFLTSFFFFYLYFLHCFPAYFQCPIQFLFDYILLWAPCDLFFISELMLLLVFLFLSWVQSTSFYYFPLFRFASVYYIWISGWNCFLLPYPCRLDWTYLIIL